MTTVKEIEAAITRLSKDEFNIFRAWFAEYDAEVWDKQNEKDVKTGKLDNLAENAIEDFKKDRCTKL